jgi:hypothetical protein
VRLRRRSLIGLAVAVAPLLASVSCSCKLDPELDVVSGKPNGAPLVKIVVTLQDEAGKCSAKVDPDRVVVYRGGVIRWLVENNCRNLSTKSLTFTQPVPRSPEKKYENETPRPWKYRFCTPKIETLADGRDEKNGLLCEVPKDVVPAIYKYNLEGAATLDPEIEVRKGG